MEWIEREDGERYAPLYAGRPTDHLRVWPTPQQGDPQPFVDPKTRMAVPEWHGALVVDGEYLEPTRVGPFPTAAQAKDTARAAAISYLTQLLLALR